MSDIVHLTIAAYGSLRGPSREEWTRQREKPNSGLFALPAWRETPFFSSREPAALASTEAVTEIGRGDSCFC